MSAPKPDLRSPEQKKAQVEQATLEARYKAAQERIRRIVSAWPPLTPEQLSNLALLLQPGGQAR